MTLTVELHDLQSNLLADISDIAFEPRLGVRYNMPRSFQISGAPAGDSRFTATAADTFRNLEVLDRKLIVWEDGEVVFHGRIFIIQRDGDGTQNTVSISAFDPWMETGFDSDEHAGRPVRDATGNFITPDFGADPISGPQLIFDVLTNSQQTGDESDPTPGEGPLPINLDIANFDVDIPPNVDLNPTGIMSWPMSIGDFLTDLVRTGVVDIRMRPIDPAESLDPYAMVDVEAGPDLGTDRHATVHFDYWTGSHNAIACRHIEDGTKMCNKLYDLLGPPLEGTGGERFEGNITPTLADDIMPGLGDRITDSRSRYGTFMQIRVVDYTGTDPQAASDPLVRYAWGAEQSYRVSPRDMLFITPAPGAAALYDAPSDFDVGDRITVNVGSDFGLPLAATQRVYGYDKTWSREGVSQLAELLTSADLA